MERMQKFTETGLQNVCSSTTFEGTGEDAASKTLPSKQEAGLQKIGFECIDFSVRLQKFRYGSGFTTQILAILLRKLLNLHKITRGAAIIAPVCPRRFLTYQPTSLIAFHY